MIEQARQKGDEAPAALAQFISELRGQVLELRDRQRLCDAMLVQAGLAPPAPLPPAHPAPAPAVEHDAVSQARRLFAEGRLGEIPGRSLRGALDGVGQPLERRGDDGADGCSARCRRSAPRPRGACDDRRRFTSCAGSGGHPIPCPASPRSSARPPPRPRRSLGLPGRSPPRSAPWSSSACAGSPRATPRAAPRPRATSPRSRSPRPRPGSPLRSAATRTERRR